jgi:23S rRNA (adenine2503-C2)-methyltransferase
MQKRILCGTSLDEITRDLNGYSIDSKYALKLAHWIYKKGITEILEIKNISKEIKKSISEKFDSGLFPPAKIQISGDKTEKYLFNTPDGRNFETVYLPEINRKTLCVSTQSGCRMGCKFCLTGRSGFRGNLTAGEIVNQVICQPHSGQITHVVFMGMGEPMDNINEVLKACDILTAEWGISLSKRNVTVSTVGITDPITEFFKKSKCNITFSLFSPFSEERSDVIPVEKKYPFKEIVSILAKERLKRKRRVSIAYIMINGINDTEKHFIALRDLLAGTKIRVNLLPYNITPGSELMPSTAEKMQFFKHNLTISGIPASIRKSRGNDISAGCGLLAAESS